MIVAGVDEVGRGCLAGPVVACAITLRLGQNFPNNLKDSKKLSAPKRSYFRDQLLKCCYVGLGDCSPQEIEKYNILWASLKAMEKAVNNLAKHCDLDEVWVDGNQKIPNLQYPQKVWIGGDSSKKCISAASIVAKVYRDELMVKLAANYPQYGFEAHKGYGTEFHRTAIKEFGVTPLHRKTFSGVKEYLFYQV